MSKFIKKQFRIDTFDACWQLFVAPKISEIPDKRYRQFLIDSEVSDHWKGCYFTQEDDETGTCYLCIWLHDLDDMGTIAHEAMHLTFDLMKRKGIKYCDESEEVYTYVLGQIVNQIISIKPQGN